MKKSVNTILIFTALLLSSNLSGYAQFGQDLIESSTIIADESTTEILTETTAVEQGVGIFENKVTYVRKMSGDQMARAASVQHDPQTGEYLIQSNGADVWSNEDETVYIWTTRPRSYRMTTQMRYIQFGGQEWAKAGIMIRNQPESEDSADLFFQMRGNEDQTERGVRFTQRGATSTRSLPASAHTSTLLFGADALEPMWLRVTRVWPANEFYFEDSNDGETWEKVNDQFSAGFPVPEEMNWGIFAFDHDASTAALPDEALFRDLTLETVVVGSRSFSPESSVKAGQALTVTITVNNEGSAVTANVSETFPTDWTVSNISDGGTASNGVISWTLSGVQGTREVTYVATPSNSAIDGAFSGEVNGIPVAGHKLLTLEASSSGSVGEFDGSSDVGSVGTAGTVTANGDDYSVTASGVGLDNSGDLAPVLSDGFHFVWKALSGDFVLEVDESELFGIVTESKSGVMVRDSLTASSSFIALFQRNDLTIRAETRDVSGQGKYNMRGVVAFGDAEDNQEPVPATRNDFGGMRLTRTGNVFAFEFKDFNNEAIWTEYLSKTMIFSDPVYVGLVVTADSDAGETAEATFTGVQITGGVPVSDWSVY